MLRIASLVLILLMSTGVIIPLAGSSAHGLRQNLIAKKRQFHHRRHSRAWWRRYRARMARLRLQRRREAAIMAHRKLVLTPDMPLPMAKSVPVTAPVSVPASISVTAPVSVPVNVPITVPVTVPVSIAPTIPVAPPVRIPVTVPATVTVPVPVRITSTISARLPVSNPVKVRPTASAALPAPAPARVTSTVAAPVTVPAPVKATPAIPATVTVPAPVNVTVKVPPTVPVTIPATARTIVPVAVTAPPPVPATTAIKTTVVASATASISLPAPAPSAVPPSAPTAAVKPELPAGWNKLASKTGEVKFRTETGGAVNGIASLDVVARSRPNPGYLTAREERRLLAGVAIGDLRRIVIDKMISDGGWVTNDYFRDVAGHRVFIVTAQTPGDGRSPDKSWNFYFTEVNGRIYRLTTNTPQEFSGRMANEAESFIASFHAISKPASK